MAQTLIALAIVGAAGAYLVRSLLPRKSSGKSGGSCGCGKTCPLPESGSDKTT